MDATSPSPLAARIRGVYGITADEADTRRLLQQVESVLHAGLRVLQYRQKGAGPELKRLQLRELKPLCAAYDALLIVNDDWQLAADLEIPAVHLGEDDGELQDARRALGDRALIGASCYASVERARALAPLTDYVAFGSIFPSGTKPQARPASLDVLREARAARLGRPIVGIGGITADNIGQVLSAGADAAAVIGALFNQPDPGNAARTLLKAASLPSDSGN